MSIGTNNQSTPADCIDFDLQLEDYSKITVLVRNLLTNSQPERKEQAETDYLCDIFSEKECHHLSGHHLQLDSLSALKCTFCRFTEHLRNRHSNVNILQSKSGNYNSPTSDKQYLSLRFRNVATSELVDWCDFQPWRSPYVLFAYASCISKEDILEALEGFEKLKSQFKKTLIVSKLFIDANGQSIDKTINEKMKLLNANPYNISTLNIDDEIKKSNFVIEKNLSNFSFNRNSSIFQFDLEGAEKQSKSLSRNASIFQQVKAKGLGDTTDSPLSGCFFNARQRQTYELGIGFGFFLGYVGFGLGSKRISWKFRKSYFKIKNNFFLIFGYKFLNFSDFFNF